MVVIVSLVLSVIAVAIAYGLLADAAATAARDAHREAVRMAHQLADDKWAWYEVAQARHDRSQNERSLEIMNAARAAYHRAARDLDDCRKAAIAAGAIAAGME